MAANRSSFINLYAKEDASDNDYKAVLECSQADLSWEGQQDLALDFNAYQFSKMVSGAKVTYDLETRFDAIESDATGANNASAISQLQVDLAAEQVARQSADTTASAARTAEVDARVAADNALQSELDIEEARAAAAEQVIADDLAQEVTDRVAAVAAEAASRASDVAGLQQQITNVLSNADAATIDSIAELLSHVNAEDATLLGQISSLQTDVATLTARLDALTQE